MFAKDQASNRLTEVLELVIFTAYALFGWLLFRIFGPEDIIRDTRPDHTLGIPRLGLSEPEAVGEFYQR
jgi:hypothetical protein